MEYHKSYDSSLQNTTLNVFACLAQARRVLCCQPTLVMDHVMEEMDISTRLYMLLSRTVTEILFDNVKFYANLFWIS